MKRGARRSFDRTRAVPPPRAYSTNALPPAAQPPSGRGRWDSLRRLPVAALALLPLRIFFGLTFLYAGLDKLLDPDFFNAASSSSIQAQFLIYERVSPLAPLVHLVEPIAPLLGALIALGEIAVGIGALTGLAFRLAALGGALISVLFFLTASWTTHPYYFGNDLPYAFGWLTLALAGHGELLVVRAARSTDQTVSADARRRAVLQVGVLAAVTVFIGGVFGVIRLIRNEAPRGVDVGDGGGSPSPGPISAPTTAASGAPSPAASAPAGIAIATVAQVQSAGARRFTVPITAPAPLPAGDPGLVIALADGTFAAYDALCTHEGCRVNYDKTAALIFCPCHSAEFDPANHAAVLGGPAPQPLLELPLIVNQADGTIALALS